MAPDSSVPLFLWEIRWHWICKSGGTCFCMAAGVLVLLLIFAFPLIVFGGGGMQRRKDRQVENFGKLSV
jgi:fumarate reductase subunit D